MGSLASEIVDLAVAKNNHDTNIYTGIGENVEQLNGQLLDTVLPLKTHLSKISKGGDGPFNLKDQFGELSNGTRTVDAILDLKNLYESHYGEGREFTIQDLNLDKLENVKKEQLTEILDHLDRIETSIKNATQDGTQRLFLHLQMALAIFNVLTEAQKTQTQHMTNLARNTRVAG